MDQLTAAPDAFVDAPQVRGGGLRAASVARWLAVAAAALMAAIILGHAVLIPGGRWDGDEYFNFALLRDVGWGWPWRRLYEWSPRPISEAVLWLYDGAVTLLGAPLITPFLLLLWTALVGGGVLALWRPGLPGAPWRLAAALGILAMFLLGHAVNEMFYWPMAAAPYLLAMTGIVVLAFRLMSGAATTTRDRTLCAFALLLALGSAESGLFFAVGFIATLAVAEAPALRHRPWPALARARWYLLPLLPAAALLLMLVSFRISATVAGVTTDATYFHHVLPSIGGAFTSLPAELFAADPFRPGPGPIGFLATDALLFAGLLGCFRKGLPQPVPRRHLIALAGGAALAIFASMAAAHFQFGTLCCERHHTFRHCLLVVFLAALARMAGQRRLPFDRHWATLGPICLAAATTVGLSSRVPAIFHDVSILHTDIEARQQNWTALHTPSLPLVFHLPARGAVIEGLHWAPGHYTQSWSSGPWYVSAMLMYFGRKDGDVVASPAASAR